MKEIITVATLLFLGIATFWDVRERRIPGGLILAGGGAELGLSLAAGLCTGEIRLWQMLAGMVPGAILLVLGVLGRQVGPADGLILCLVGLGESYVFALWMLMVACAIMGGISLTGMAMRRLKKEDRLPFVPFLSAGYVICLCLQTGRL